MVSFNRVVLAGNLTRDPELRFTQEGMTCSPGQGLNRYCWFIPRRRCILQNVIPKNPATLLENTVVSMHPQPIGSVPGDTARVAKAAFPKGNVYIQMRNVLGSIY